MAGKRDFKWPLDEVFTRPIPYDISALVIDVMTGSPESTKLIIGENPAEQQGAVEIPAGGLWNWSAAPARAWIVNLVAQPGLMLEFRVAAPGETIGAAASAVQIVDTSQSQINPATEETLAAMGQLLTVAPTVYNKEMTNADEEYSQALSAETNRVFIQTRDGTAFRLAFVTGKVATPTAPWLTIPADGFFADSDLDWSGVTLYFACADAGKIIEVLAA